MKRQTYTPEIKERAFRMLIEASGDYPFTSSAIQAIASKIGCTSEGQSVRMTCIGAGEVMGMPVLDNYVIP